MINAAYDINDCYQQVGNDIIDKYYSRKAVEMKEKFENFVKATYSIFSAAQFDSDACKKGCGNMNELYIADTRSLLKDVVRNIISFVELES